MKVVLTSLALSMFIHCLSALGTAAYVRSPEPPAAALIVTGTINNGGVFTGTFNVHRFAELNGHIAAIGDLNGTLTDETGNDIGTVADEATSLTATPGTVNCEVVELQLGPLDVYLLHSMVHLDRANLGLTGSGNAPGSAACTVARLIEGDGPVTKITGLLNKMLNQL